MGIATDEDRKDALVLAVVRSTYKLFSFLLPDESPDDLATITCSVLNEVLNRIDTETEWNVSMHRIDRDDKSEE